MARFTVRILLFFFPLAIALGGWSAYVYWGERQLYRREMALPPGTGLVVIGDSEAAYAFDPAECRGLVNLSAQGMSLDQCLYKFRDLIRINGAALTNATVVLAVSPARFAAPLDAMRVNAFEGRYVFLNVEHARDSVRELDAPFLLWRDRELMARTYVLTRTWRRTKKSKPPKSECVGGHVRWDRCGFTEDRKRAEEKCSRYADVISGSFAKGEGADAERVLGELLGLARRNGVRVVLATTPYHKKVRAALPQHVKEGFASGMRRLAHGWNVRWLDWFAMELPDEAFLDGTHVNAIGGTILGKALLNAL